MKELVNTKIYYRLNNKSEWMPIIASGCVCYSNREECEEWSTRSLNFNEFIKLINLGCIPEAKVERSIFGKEIAVLPAPRVLDRDIRLTAKKVNSIQIKRTYEFYDLSLDEFESVCRINNLL